MDDGIGAAAVTGNDGIEAAAVDDGIAVDDWPRKGRFCLSSALSP